MSLSDNYPDIRPQWMNDYANAGVIDPRCSFARSDSTPSNVHYWSDEDHLSSENLLLDSKTGTANWTGDSNGAALFPVVTANHAASPDGTANQATRVQLDLNGNTTSNDYTRYYQAHNVASGTSATFAVWIKSTDGASSYAAQILSPDGSGVAVTITGSWQKFTVTADSYGNITYGVRLRGGQTPTNADTADILIWGANLSTTGQTVLSETTTQIHREYAATLKPVSYSGQPRFEYEPTGDREAKGLLIEGQAQNLIPYSSAINSWVTKGNVTITDAAAVGPNGTLSASLVRPTGATSLQHYIRENITTVASSSYTFSAYVKPAGYTKLLLVGEQTAWPYTDYVNATFTLTGAGSVTTGAGSATITALSDGWYQITATGTAATTSSYALISVLNDAGDLVYTADSYSGILITAVQYEQNSRQSSYIATSGSPSTRTQDSLSVATADIGYTGGPVSAVVEGSAGSGSSPHLLSLSDATVSNRWLFYRPGATASTSTNYRLLVQTNGSSVVSENLSGSSSATKFAMRVDNNDFAACADGGAIVADTAGVSPVTTTIHIANGYNGSNQANGHIKRVALYSEALTDTELQSLTS